MLGTFNGFGTTVCPARGFACIEEGEAGVAFDAVTSYVAFYMPLVPLGCVHTFNWQRETFQQVPLRWSWAMVVSGFARRWAVLFLIIAIVAAANTGAPSRDSSITSTHVVVLAVACLTTSAVLYLGFLKFDQRHRRIRRMMGRHELGNSDPASWTDDTLALVPTAAQLYGTATFTDAVPILMASKRFSDAMYAARLAVARENGQAGEKLTDQVLAGGVPDLLSNLEMESRVGNTGRTFYR